jgi:hypothetical protein
LLLLLWFGARLRNMLNFLIACDGDDFVIEQIVSATSLRKFVDGNSLIGHFVVVDLPVRLAKLVRPKKKKGKSICRYRSRMAREKLRTQ